MRKITTFILLFISVLTYAQIDYSDNWEDFFSYNDVKDIIVSNEVLYALTDNAIFSYDFETEETEKLSAINGLSGGETSAIYYNETYEKLIIGYENGLLEIIDASGEITVAPQIVNFNQTGDKSINHIYEYDNKLYLATGFGIVVYDIENLEFGDTYFIGNNSSSVVVNQITVLNNEIYAATNDGIYIATTNANNLVDSANWDLIFTNNYQKIITFNDTVYTINNNTLSVINNTTISSALTFSETINDIKTTESNLIVALNTKVISYDNSLIQVTEKEATVDFDYTVNTSTLYNNNLLIGTNEYGVLINENNTDDYTEIHPKGPLSNDIFSITAFNNNLWVVYGGYDGTHTPIYNREGYSHFNGENWINKSYNPNNPTTDLVHITIDEEAENRVFISSFGATNQLNTNFTGGLFEIENDEIKTFYNNFNSPLEDIGKDKPLEATVRISDTKFDDENNLWITNLGVEYRLKKLSSSGEWSQYNINDILTVDPTRFGFTDLDFDRNETKWMATRGNGVLVFNENGNRKKAFTTEVNKGSLPNNRVESLAVDLNNNIWIGTISGLVVFYNAESIFTTDNYNAESIIISQDGVAERLLGDQNIKSIVVDGANNKWFGTDSGGALKTNPNGQTTLANFSTDNSPLPSNTILKIAIDDSNGKVFFVTDKGMVAYNSNVVPFGDELGEVYAYPNPVLKNHDTVTIDGRNGSHLPENTNVKILDTAGNLVYETNVVEGEQLGGGKVIWNKCNLRGTKVASGIYIVLMSTEDGSESTTTKIAIVN